jgi:homoserine dehydrogenase
MDDPEVSIVCETMGGAGAAYEFTKAALSKGKSVCTSNKELVEKHGPELIALARKNNCNYLFEASVGGGIPIIRPMNTSLAQEHIESIMGILNCTTNYILTKMDKEGADYSEVLKQAQDLGYAERNPEADVEGHDAGRKIAILASLMTGKTVRYEDIYVEGITAIESVDFAFAGAMGRTVKLIARASDKDGEFTAVVAPHMISADHPLGGVNDVFNAVYVTGNMLGDVMFYGKGAGKLATASAVVSDVLDIARADMDGVTLPCTWGEGSIKPADHKKCTGQFFLRVKDADAAALKSAVSGLKEVDSISGWTGFTTDVMTEEALDKAAAGIDHKMIRLL